MPVREAECRCKFPETHGGVILMKRILALMLLTLGALALTAPTAPPQATQKKEIKDQAEYNAYVTAIQATDINAKISGLETLSPAYPTTVLRDDGVQGQLQAYLQN